MLQICKACALLSLCTLVLPLAQAHFLPAQRGTLNVVDDGAFMVLSLPVSAFQGIDDDGDGRLSTSEFETHHDGLINAITRGVRLFDEHGPRPLQGVMLSPSPAHADPEEAALQLIAMGRFALASSTAKLRIELGLFGTQPAEQALELTTTRRQTGKRETVTLTPDSPTHALLPAW